MKTRLVRTMVWTCVIGVGVVVAGYGGYKGYQAWRQKRLVAQAREFLEQGELRKSLISAQRAIRSNPRDVSAARVMAALADADRSRASMVWRHRIVELEPNSVSDRLALAQTAVLYQDHAAATNALAGVPEDARNTAEYRNVAGVVAAMLGDSEKAEKEFADAATLRPDDPSVQLNLRVLRLQGTNEQERAEARVALQRLAAEATDTSIRCRAYRELIHDATRTGNTNAAVGLAESLLREPGALFGDRLLRLEVLLGNRSTNMVESLKAVRAEAAEKVGWVNQLILWEMRRVHPARTMEWVASLPEEQRTNASVAMLASDLRVSIQDWVGLSESLEDQNWGGMEFLRHAYRCLAMQRQKLTDGARVEWGLTMKAADAQLGPLNLLLRMAARWGWPDEMREILQVIVNRHPKEQWAFEMLSRNLASEGQTRALLTLYSRRLNTDPGDLYLKNNVAMLAMLLGAEELRPHDLARQVYDASPTNHVFLSTYGFSLYAQGKHAEALGVLERMTPDQRETPAVAAYYALALAANGRREEASRYFELAREAKMLPEERKLIERARGSL